LPRRIDSSGGTCGTARSPARCAPRRRPPAFAAAAQRGGAVAFVCRDDDVGGLVRAPLQPAHQPVEEVLPTAEPGQVQLGYQVVLVEYEPGSMSLEPLAEQEEQVWRIAGVHHVDPADLAGQPVGPPQRRAVLAQVADRAADRRAQRVPVDLNAVDLDLGLGVPPCPLWTDDVHLPAGVPQRGALLPHAAVERHRQVLDEDERLTSQGPRTLGQPGARRRQEGG
jgi:hypothetical protein